FLVGVSWPREMIPPALDRLRRVFPSESAIDGLVRIGQMGAHLAEMRADWLYLWLLAASYFILAVAASRRRLTIEPADAVQPQPAASYRRRGLGPRRGNRHPGVSDPATGDRGTALAGARPIDRDRDRPRDQRPPGALCRRRRSARAPGPVARRIVQSRA